MKPVDGSTDIICVNNLSNIPFCNKYQDTKKDFIKASDGICGECKLGYELTIGLDQCLLKFSDPPNDPSLNNCIIFSTENKCQQC